MKHFILCIIFISGLAAAAQPENGKPAPKLNITDWITPPSISEKPKVIIVEFWATWCAPCIASVPHLNELADKYKNEVSFIAVSNERRSKIESFLKKKDIRSSIVSDTTNTTHTNFSITSIPRTFVINASGILVWQGIPTWLNDSIIQSAMDGKLPVLQTKQISSKKTEEKKNDLSFTIDLIKPGTVNEEIFAEKYDDSLSYMKLYNLDLPTVIQKFYGISWPRIISTGPKYDMNLSVLFQSKKISLKTKEKAHDFMLRSLQVFFNFSVCKVKRFVETYSITISNQNKFNKCKNTAVEKGSHVSSNEKEVISTNVDLSQFKGRFEDDFEVLLSGNKALKDKYDITYPTDNFEIARKHLEEEYGITLVKARTQEEFLELRFDKK